MCDSCGSPSSGSVQAGSVVTQWMWDRYPVWLNPLAPVAVADDSSRLGYTLPSLIRLTSAFSKSRVPNCSASVLRQERTKLRYLFRVKCGESYSRGPWICRIQLEPPEKDMPGSEMWKRQIRVSCNCPFWVYWAPNWNAHENDFLEGPSRGPLLAPTIRDPQHKNWICKHVAAAAPYFYRLVPADWQAAVAEQESEEKRQEELDKKKEEREQRKEDEKARREEESQKKKDEAKTRREEEQARREEEKSKREEDKAKREEERKKQDQERRK